MFFSCARFSMCKGVLSLNVFPARWRANAGQPVLPLRSGEEGAHCDIELFGVLARVRSNSCTYHIAFQPLRRSAVSLLCDPHRIRTTPVTNPLRDPCRSVYNPLRVCWRPIVDTLQARYKPVAE